MIVTVTCNPAIDVTYRVGHLEPGAVHRVTRVVERPGGKGVNVARVLHQLGEETLATGLADADFERRVSALVPCSFVPALPAVRRTVVVHTDDSTTGFWEPGQPPEDPSRAAASLLDHVDALLEHAHALVVSGSLPASVDEGLPAALAGRGRARGIPVIVDVDEGSLQIAADAGGVTLVPNRDELSRLVGTAGTVDVPQAVRALAARTSAPVIATLGADGMVAATAHGCWRATAPSVVDGNPTGAGDSAAAAIVRGLVRRTPWPELLVDAVAVSAAAVASPVAGEIELDLYRRWRPRVTVAALDTSQEG